MADPAVKWEDFALDAQEGQAKAAPTWGDFGIVEPPENPQEPLSQDTPSPDMAPSFDDFGEKPGAFTSAFKEARAKTIGAGMIAGAQSMYPSDMAGDVETGLTEEQMEPDPEWEAKAAAFKQQKKAERAAYLKGLEADTARATKDGGIGAAIAAMGGYAVGTFTDPLALGFGRIGAAGKLLSMARLAKLSAAGGAYEAAANTLEQTTSKENFDWVEVAGRTGLGMVATPVGDVVLRGIGRGIGRILTPKGVALTKLDTNPDAVFKPKELATFNAKLNQLQDATNRYIAQGKQHFDALAMAEKEVGLSPETTMHLINATGKDFVLPEPQVAKLAVEHAGYSVDKWKEGTLINELITPVISRIKDIDERVWHHARNYILETKQFHHKELQATEHMSKAIEKLGKGDRALVEAALRNADFAEAKKIFYRNNIDSRKAFSEHVEAMKRIADVAQKVYGSKWKPIAEGYSARIIKDVKEFTKNLSGEEHSFVMKALNEMEEKLKRPLNDVEKTKVIHDALFKGVKPTSKLPDAVFTRRWKKIPDSMQHFYHDYRQSMHIYITNMIDDLSKRKFLGTYAVEDAEIKGINYEKSVANLLKDKYRLLADNEKMSELRNLLTLVLSTSSNSPRTSLQHIRNLTYMMTLGNPLSAATQLKDVGIAAKRYGLLDTVKAIAGPKAVKLAEFGIQDAAEEMIHSPNMTARWMEKMLKLGGFQAMDMFGKNTIVNAAYRQATKLASDPDGVAKLASKYAKAYGKDFGNLIDSLKTGKIDQNVKLMLFHELSDIQPVSRLEMPAKWLKHPDGRIAYTLSTFALRQLDLILRDTYREMRKGNVKTGVKNIMTYAVYLGLAGAGVDTIKDVMKGKPPNMETLDDKVVNNLMAIFLLDSYAVARFIKSGHPSMIVGGRLGTPIDVLATPVSDAVKIAKGKMDIKDAQTWSNVPLIGKLYHYWLGGGFERAVKKGEDHFLD